MTMRAEINGHQLELLPEKAIFWPQHRILLLADLHLGKVNHFRRSGVAMPTNPNSENLDRFIGLIQRHQPLRVIFLGDLFHSHYNDEWEAFGQVLKHYPAISFELVMGNHDIMSRHQYEKHRLRLHAESLELDDFILTHEPGEYDAYNLAGHIHPGVRLQGRGSQLLKFPCFHLSPTQFILLAFGAFSFVHAFRPKI